VLRIALCLSVAFFAQAGRGGRHRRRAETACVSSTDCAASNQDCVCGAGRRLFGAPTNGAGNCVCAPKPPSAPPPAAPALECGTIIYVNGESDILNAVPGSPVGSGVVMGSAMRDTGIVHKGTGSVKLDYSSSNKVKFDTSFSLTGDFEISTQVYSSASGLSSGNYNSAWSTDWSAGGGVNMDMYLKHSDRPKLYINGCSGSPLQYQGGAYQPADTWVKLSAVRSGSTLKFLVNDVEQASTTCTGTISANKFYIGGSTADTPPGYVDELKVIDRTITC